MWLVWSKEMVWGWPAASKGCMALFAMQRETGAKWKKSAAVGKVSHKTAMHGNGGQSDRDTTGIRYDTHWR